MAKFTPTLQALFLFVFACLLYANTLGHGYALDDAIVITDNVIVQRGVSGWGELFTTDTFFGFFQDADKMNLVAGGRYRPLTPALFALEHQLFGGPFALHLFNVLWYALLVVVVFGLLREIARGKKLAAWFALAGAALFAAHPLHTEAVANIKGRDEILALLGCLVATWAVFRAADRKSWTYALGGGAAYFLGCLSKENAITFLAVVPLVIWACRRDRYAAGDLKYCAPVLGAGILFLILRTSVIGFSLGEPVLELMNNPFLKIEGGRWVHMTGGERLATVFHTLWVYVRLLFVPVGLVHDYYPAAIEMKGWTSIGTLLGLVTHFGAGIYAILHLRARPLIATGILTYLFTLSIVSNVFFSVGTFMSERFLFMPSFGFVLAVAGAAAGAKFLDDRQRGWLLAGVVAVFSVLTVLRNPVWQDNFTLFTTDVERQPDSAKLLNAAGGVKVDAYQQLPEARKPGGKYLLTEAVAHLTRAVEVHPTYQNAFLLRGNANLLLENYDAAIADYDRALELNGGYQLAADNLLIALTAAGRNAGEKRGDLAGSLRYLQRALQLDPNDYETLRLLGVANGMSGKADVALTYFERAVRQRPDNADAVWNYGTALYRAGRTAEAETQFARAEQLKPGIRAERGG